MHQSVCQRLPPSVQKQLHFYLLEKARGKFRRLSGKVRVVHKFCSGLPQTAQFASSSGHFDVDSLVCY